MTTSFRTPGAPFIVNFGGGVDSTAMLIELVRRELRPDFILFADTGAEKPETLEHVRTFSLWLEARGFPAVTIARYQPARVTYRTLEECCLTNETLPSLAFGYKSCSLKFKAQPMDRWLSRQPAIKAAWSAGLKPVKAIGYDCGPIDSKRAVDRSEDKRFSYVYPLRAWGGFDRAACEAVCQEALGYVPQKSACFFCPAMKEAELRDLATNHRDLFDRALALEDNARTGKHGLKKIEGLWGRTRKKDGRPGSWRAWAEREGLLAAAPSEVVLEAEVLELAEMAV